MSGLCKVNTAIQLGDSATATQNAVLRSNKDGTFTLARGNLGATTQDLLTFDANGKVSSPQGPAARTDTVSMVRLHGSPGNGSTNTSIRRFTTTDVSTGTDVTYADSATAGGSFTINTAGIYAISFSAQCTAAAFAAIIRNQTTWSSTTDAANTLAMSTGPASGQSGCAAWTGYLPAATVIRGATNSATVGANTSGDSFTIVRVS